MYKKEEVIISSYVDEGRAPDADVAEVITEVSQRLENESDALNAVIEHARGSIVAPNQRTYVEPTSEICLQNIRFFQRNTTRKKMNQPHSRRGGRFCSVMRSVTMRHPGRLREVCWFSWNSRTFTSSH